MLEGRPAMGLVWRKRLLQTKFGELWFACVAGTAADEASCFVGG
jgi:hypothetical protein